MLGEVQGDAPPVAGSVGIVTESGVRSNTDWRGPTPMQWAHGAVDLALHRVAGEQTTQPYQAPGYFPFQTPTPYYGDALRSAQHAGRPLKSNMGLAALATLLFFPVGAFAMYLAGQVDMTREMGDLLGAMEKANKARTFSLIALVMGAGIWMIILAVYLMNKASDPTMMY